MVFGFKLGLPLRRQPSEPPPQNDASLSARSASSSGPSSKVGLTVNEFVARTKRIREKGLEPTKPELIAYARYLGIDPIADGDLMWISDEALNAPLPAEWTEHHDSADRVFYYNVNTHASSWTHPLEQLHRDMYKEIVRFRSGDLSKEEQAAELDSLRHKCEEAERDAHKELQVWTEHLDEQGQKFFYNRERQQSVWTDPRPARCHTLYLQMKALRVLSKHCGHSSSTRGPEPLSSDFGRPFFSPREASGNAAVSALKGDRPLYQGALSARSSEAASSAEEDSSEPAENEKIRRKKKRRDKDGKDDLVPLETVRDEGLPSPLGKLDNHSLVSKRTASSAVEEARAALGVSQIAVPPTPRGRGLVPGPTMGNGRLPSPLGDGLTSIGRAKVRAGIRLEPLQAV